MRILKRFMALCSIALFVLGIFAGCQESEGQPPKEEIFAPGNYSIEVSDYVLTGNPQDGYYIRFSKEYSSESTLPGMETTDIQFDSIQDFATTVLEGNLSEYQKGKISRVFPSNDQGAITCDFANLQEVVLPDGMIHKDFYWSGAVYSQFFGTEEDTYGNVIVYTKDSYDAKYQKDYVNRLNKSSVTVSKKEKVSDRNASVIYFSTQLADMKCVRYELISGNKTYLVSEEYLLSAYAADQEWVSETVPYRIHMYCTDGNNYYVVNLYHLESRPTSEWLLSFALSKYVNNTERK